MVGSMALCVPSTRGDVTMPAGPTVSALREVKPSDVHPLGLLTQSAVTLGPTGSAGGLCLLC